MGLYFYIIKDKEYYVYIRNHDKSQPYRSLCFALLNFISESQLNFIKNVNRRGDNIIFFHELIDCFRYGYEIGDNDPDDCICGKKHIENKFIIYDKETNEDYIVGSTCVENWLAKKINPNACEFCKRLNKLGGNCKNCKKMKSIREKMLIWLEYARETIKLKKEKIHFGKFKGQKYYTICQNESKNKWWINFVLSNECKTKDDYKLKLQRMRDLVHRENHRKSDFDICRQMEGLTV